MPAARTLVARSCAPARSRCTTAPASLSQVMDTDESGALYPLGWEGGWEREVANARGKEGYFRAYVCGGLGACEGGVW